jgi:putative membrane protein
MIRSLARAIALGCFAVYVALFPGSTLTTAFDAIPPDGAWLGPALLIGQGIAAFAWMVARWGGRGASVACVALAVAWAAEHLGETRGLPFGRYSYTDAIQPQLFGVVPLPILLAWLMLALGAWQLARISEPGSPWRVAALSAALVVVIDLQIEPVTTLIHGYWRWIDTGSYYGVPPLNFAGWALVGFVIAWAFERWLGPAPTPPVATGRLDWLAAHVPALLFVLNALMFTVINLVRGYTLAGMVGLAFLAIWWLVARRVATRAMATPAGTVQRR